MAVETIKFKIMKTANFKIEDFSKENHQINAFSQANKFADLILNRMGFPKLHQILCITCIYEDKNFNLFFLMFTFELTGNVPKDCKNTFVNLLN